MSEEKKRNISGLIGAFLMIVVGLALTPTIGESVDHVTGVGGDNLTGAALTIMSLVPVFWVIMMIAIPVAYIGIWLKG